MEFGDQVAAYRGRLVGMARAMFVSYCDIDDVVSDVILRALERQSRFDGENLGGWLFGIMRNRVREYRRGWVKEREHVGIASDDCCEREDSEVTIPVPPPQPMALAMSEVAQALADMPDYHRDIIETVAILGVSYREYAALRAIPIGTAQSRLARALRSLRTRLETGVARSQSGPGEVEECGRDGTVAEVSDVSTPEAVPGPSGTDDHSLFEQGELTVEQRQRVRRLFRVVTALPEPREEMGLDA